MQQLRQENRITLAPRCTWRSATLVSALIALGVATSVPCIGAPAEFAIGGRQLSAAVSVDGAYEIRGAEPSDAIVRSRVGALINHHWISSNEYPRHWIRKAEFTDALGSGQELTVTFTGLAHRPDLAYRVRTYEREPFGDIDVQVQNRTSKAVTVQVIRMLDAIGEKSLNLGPSGTAGRVMSDTFSENPVLLEDLGRAPQGRHVAVGSQLVYNRDSRRSIFFGALSADRFVTVLRLQVAEDATKQPRVESYVIDSTGTTELRPRDPPENHVAINLPLPAGATLTSETLMFSTGGDYHAQLESYGAAIRKLHHARVNSPSVKGWWSSPWEYNTSVTEGQAYTNAEWLAQHLRDLGYDFFHIDASYAYSLGEFTHVNGATFPNGMRKLGRDVAKLGLNFGIWVAPLEVGERSWVFQHHKDWLVRDARGQPLLFPASQGLRVAEQFGVLDATHPCAREYLRQTYRALTREWGARYIKLDYMDSTAVEGYYHRPHTTALEALRIALQTIRDAVGEDVLLDKDGSPMLTPVGLVDQGRVSKDSAHGFENLKDQARGIMARYYMHRNFFVNDPDAFTLLPNVPPAPGDTDPFVAPPLTLDEATMSIVLAASSGGMFEIGDDLPTLSAQPERAALLRNEYLLQMPKLGRAARPVDLMDYEPEDLQPSVAFLREDERHSILMVFNWTDQGRSHQFAPAALGLPNGHVYELYDALSHGRKLPFDGKMIDLSDQPPHSVRLVQIVDQSVPTSPEKLLLQVPENAKMYEPLTFAASLAANDVALPADYRWEFGDGVTLEGTKVTHTYTAPGTYALKVTSIGANGVAVEKGLTVTVTGRQPIGPPVRHSEGEDQKEGCTVGLQTLR